MIFQNKFHLAGTLLCLIIYMFSCQSKNSEQTNTIKLDSIEFDGLFFAGEEIIVKANDSIVFSKKVDSLKRFNSMYGEFIIPKYDTINLSVEVFFQKRKTMDTTFIIPASIFINSIGGSICYPSYLSEDSLRKITMPHFGFIPVDSCKRYFYINARFFNARIFKNVGPSCKTTPEPLQVFNRKDQSE